MSYTFRQNLVNSSKYSIKCPYSMDAQYITIHNTSNSASADAEIRYMINNDNQTSYHVCVDEKEVIQAIPFNRNAWHAGDGGSGTGNRKSIGIEIARSTGDLNLFKMELEDGESEDMINDKLISDHVSSIYQKGNYLYIELRQLDLDEYFDDKWKEWENQRQLENEEYWESRF